MAISALPSANATQQLVKLATGEYSATSVAANPMEAIKLGLVKMEDGNYGAKPAPKPTGPQSSPRVLFTLTGFNLGGA